MPWLTNFLVDYQLRRRRFVLACFGIVCASGIGVDAFRGASEKMSIKNVSVAALGLVMTLYFARMALREFARMKAE